MSIRFLGLVGVGCFLAGCGTVAVNGADSMPSSPPAPAANVTVTPNGRTDTVDTPITVTVTGGRLEKIVVKNSATGGNLRGTITEDGTSWVSNRQRLPLSTVYKVKGSTVNADGVSSPFKDTVRTPVPRRIANPVFTGVANNGVYGVGMPIVLTFAVPMETKRSRSTVLDNVHVTSSKPTSGAWVWNATHTQVTFRPRTYWPAKAKIRVTTTLKGKQLTKGGVWADHNADFRMRTGAKHVFVADNTTHSMKVYRGGRKVTTIPITMGKPGFTTRSGVKVISEKLPAVVMDAATGGTSRNDPEYYRLNVKWAMRMTNSGEFVHAAPWSVGSQGSSNVSHGCIGMNTTAARKLFNSTLVGDVIVVKGTGRGLEQGNGITVWNVPWNKWKKQSESGVVPVTNS